MRCVGQPGQPLYSGDDFAGSGATSLCWSGYQSQNASNNDQRDTTFVTNLPTFNTELTNPGNSGFGFVQVHDLSDPDCQTALANGGTLSHSNGNGSGNNDDDTCLVPYLIEQKYDNDAADGEKWNNEGAGEFNFISYSSKRKVVKSMSPAPGSKVDCDTDLTLNFK